MGFEESTDFRGFVTPSYSLSPPRLLWALPPAATLSFWLLFSVRVALRSPLCFLLTPESIRGLSRAEGRLLSWGPQPSHTHAHASWEPHARRTWLGPSLTFFPAYFTLHSYDKVHIYSAEVPQQPLTRFYFEGIFFYVFELLLCQSTNRWLSTDTLLPISHPQGVTPWGGPY